jgi:nucleoside 2-deoxyribosyltransferase
MTKLFLSGPLFTVAEREFNAGLARFLDAQGFEVWLPQERVPRGGAKAIFQSCVKGIEWADAVVACMDGPDPDSGTAWEVGYAYAKRKPIVCYRSDFRSGGDTKGAPYNLMLSEAATARIEFSSKANAADLHRQVVTQIRKALRVRPAKR